MGLEFQNHYSGPNIPRFHDKRVGDMRLTTKIMSTNKRFTIMIEIFLNITWIGENYAVRNGT